MTNGHPGPEQASLWSKNFIILMAATFITYANYSVFFQYYDYLATLPIDIKWAGLLIGVYSAVSLIVRPLVSPFFHPGNSRRYVLIGTVAVVVSLLSYSLTTGFLGMLLVRSLHGVAFVVLGAALMSVIVINIPPKRSGQAFGLISIVILLPNTVIPPVMPWLTGLMGGFTQVLVFFAGITLLAFPLIFLTGRTEDRDGGPSPQHTSLSRREILENLTDRNILLLLASMIMLYSGHALVFFFLSGYAESIGLVGVGFFFTLASVGEIGVRVVLSTYFDRTNKYRLAGWSLAGLAAAYVLLGYLPGRIAFFSLGLVIGLGWGVVMPVLNSLMFDISTPRSRPFNTNLGLVMFQAGFFVGPFIGGYVAANLGFPVLFVMCAVFSVMGAGAVLLIRPETDDMKDSMARSDDLAG